MGTWGGANRPVTSNKLGIPTKADGADGDLQIRQTQLGAKLFGKIGGRWYDSPFSIDGTTKIGTKLSDHLAITREGIEIYDRDVKVASFGRTMNIGNWNINSTSIYTGTEDHSGYTANVGDITIYSDGSDSSIHAKYFYIGADGKFYSTGGSLGSGTTFSGATWNGVDLTNNEIANNTITDALLGFSAQSWTTDMEVRGTAYNAIIWDKGSDANPTLTFADGTTQVMTKNTSTGLADNTTFFVYVTENTGGAATVAVSSDYTDAVAQNVILLATVVTTTAAGGGAPSIFPYKTNALTISAASIAANAITATAIATDTITANEIDGGTITIDELATIANIALSGQIILTSGGTDNIVIGSATSNDAGTANVVLGVGAGNSLVSDSENNILIGKNAGRLIDSTDADNNIAIGTCALENLDETSAATYMASNVAIGTSSMENFDSGGFNISIGHNSMKAASGASGISNVSIGHAAMYDIDAGNSNTCIGGGSGADITSGSQNICVGSTAGNAITTGHNNISIGATSDCAAGVNGQIAIGYGASTTGVYAISIGNALQSIEDTIRVGRNVAGNYWSMDFTSSTTWAHSSDIRMKRNIQDDTLGLSFINDLRTKTFQYKPSEEFPEEWEDYNIDDNGNKIYPAMHNRVMHGMIAQDVKAALDTAGVDTFGMWSENEKGVQQLAGGDLVYPLTKAVQELSAKLDTMQTEINNLKAE